MDRSIIFERDDFLYLVGNVAPTHPTDAQVEEFAFADSLRSRAPNQNILWLQGRYVEGERPNGNGQMWSRSDIEIKSLTPRLMPVTVMHDLRTAVGLIADARLLTPEKDQVEVASIDTALAIWAHRFPEIADEIAHNHEQGTLMQSQECLASAYSCIECGTRYSPRPRHAERDDWCSHLRDGAANGKPVRRLEDVTFTGTGLIFGSRGVKGALDTAHLETFQSEVAELHQRAHYDAQHRTPRRRASVETIEIKRSEYDELQAKASQVPALTSEVSSLKETAAKVPDLEKKVDELEIESKKHADEAAAEKSARETLEEEKRATELSASRVSGLGSAFLAKLPDTVKSRLSEQAKTLSDDDWKARLDELAELTGAKPDEQGGQSTAAGTEMSSTQFGVGPSGDPATPGRHEVSATLGGLFRSVRPTPPKTGDK